MAQSEVGGHGSVSVALAPPHGREQIVTTFGDIYEYIRGDGSLDPRWQADFLVKLVLPFALRLSWDTGRTVGQMTSHKRMAEIFAGVFERIAAEGLQEKVHTFGGCFSFRPQRGGTKLSTHAWGIAVDLNPGTNLRGTKGDMDAGIVEAFRNTGFIWGGEWEGKRRDPMHFQYCSGY
jgi:hypothetical protein